MRMHEESCGGLTAACNGLDGLFGFLFLSPTRTEWPTRMLQFIGWSLAAAAHAYAN